MAALPGGGAAGPSHLRMCMIGGDAVTTSLAEAFSARWPQASLLNVYGMTEMWDVSCYDASRLVDGPQVPIGRPIANTQIYVLDRHGPPAPLAVGGERYVVGGG